MRIALFGTIACCTVFAGQLAGQNAHLPTNAAESTWVVAGTHEVVGWFTFDPATVADRLPDFVRFVTVGELASSGVPWASDYMGKHPTHTSWGISFLEVVQSDTFAVGGHQPTGHGQIVSALWFARVLPRTDSHRLQNGLPLLMLEFWMADSAFATFMRRRGIYASYADVRMWQRGDRWEGAIVGDDFTIRVACTPSGSESGGRDSRATQVLVPPRGSGLNTVVTIALAGHRERGCAEARSWAIEGRHPLGVAVPVESSSLQYGYRLQGRVDARFPEP
jgi:hypothetical protein